MTQNIKIKRLKGQSLLPYIPELAKLRIEIFKNYPYLYVGDMEYETNYLKTYIQCPESIMVLVFDNDKVVGASTAIPLEFETIEFQKPFLEHGFNIKDIFYFGESLLLPEYRGQKIYRIYFQEREQAAKEYGCKIAAFCEVYRDVNDPRKPKDYVSLDEVWKYFGFQKQPDLFMFYPWKEVGEETQSEKKLVFWLKDLLCHSCEGGNLSGSKRRSK